MPHRVSVSVRRRPLATAEGTDGEEPQEALTPAEQAEKEAAALAEVVALASRPLELDD